MSLIPNVLWAQRSDRLFVTLDLQDAAGAVCAGGRASNAAHAWPDARPGA